MYTPSFMVNISAPSFKAIEPDLLNKGLHVTNKEEWQELLSNVSSNECRQSFRKIFDHFFPLLVNLGIKNGLSKEVASELAQDTMVKVWAKAGSYDPRKGNVSLWILTIARNIRFDYFRNHKNDPLQVKTHDLYAIDDFLTRDELEQEVLFDLGILKKHMLDLPTEQREIIEKVYFNGFTHEEISKTHNIPLGTVKSRLRLAITSMKTKFGGESK